MSKFDVDTTVYVVRKVVFRSEDTMAEGDYVFVMADRDRVKAEQAYAAQRELGEWCELTARRITETRLDQSHKEMPEEW